ncbi:MAG: ABC transporter permease [Anaerostipes sp.]|nr:ABC transporter permease [Anaerostipes sp.]
MRNPLQKRLFRELKGEAGKYVVIFLLMAATIGFVSGFLVADESMRITYDESFEKYNVEDGYFDVAKGLNQDEINAIEENGIKLYENYYVEKKLSNKTTIRIFSNRKEVDQVCLMEGRFPKKKGEIAIDRMYANNNHIKVGALIKSGNQQWKVTGYVALSDYSALFSNNNDTMFDAVKFGVAVVSKDEFSAFSKKEKAYRYAWTYNTKPANEQKENDIAEELMKSMGKVITLKNFVPQYQNQAICFTGNDMGSDKAMMTALLYIVMAILAFVFGITISNTISKEANTIGTLRASGYTKRELVSHYLSMPLFVTFVGAGVGNVIGYTVIVNVVSKMYYGSYSLTKFVNRWSMEALIKTTIIPLVIMFIVNLVILNYKLSLSPLKLIRRDLKRKKQTKAIRLNEKISFFSRFRLRIIIQNMSNYGVLFVGIIFANLLLLFGLGLPVVLDNYQDEIQNNMLSKYQYMLSVPVSVLSDESKIHSMLGMLEFSTAVDTDNETAEKFTAYSLNTTDSLCDSEEIIIYGVKKNSQYIPIDFKENEVYISDGYADKYQLKAGDTITLKEKYKNDRYRFKVAGIYHYQGALSIFMDQSRLNQTFDLDKSYFSGYFSDTKIIDVNQKYIGSVLDLEALTKVSRQLDVSMGNMMYLVDGFAVIIFMVLIYLLSKIVIEKNGQSISMAKILGYENREIGKLYILSTSIMVVLFLLLSMVIDYYSMVVIFRQIMLNSMSGWIQFHVDYTVFVKMFLLGIVTYSVVAILEMRKIKKVPMDEALKNVE